MQQRMGVRVGSRGVARVVAKAGGTWAKIQMVLCTLLLLHMPRCRHQQARRRSQGMVGQESRAEVWG